MSSGVLGPLGLSLPFASARRRSSWRLCFTGAALTSFTAVGGSIRFTGGGDHIEMACTTGDGVNEILGVGISAPPRCDVPTSTVALCRLVIRRTIASPRPEPPASRARASSGLVSTMASAAAQRDASSIEMEDLDIRLAFGPERSREITRALALVRSKGDLQGTRVSPRVRGVLRDHLRTS